MDFTELLNELKAYRASQDEKLEIFRKQLDAVRAEMLRPDGGGHGRQEHKSIGQLFCESGIGPRFAKDWGQNQQAAFEYEGSLFPRSTKTLVESVALGWATPGILMFEREPGIVKPPQRRVRVRDLIPFTPTTLSGVEYLKEKSFVNAASPQEEGYSKGESEILFEICSTPVQCLAHWIPAARQVLDDLPQLQTYIDTRLLDLLADVEDYELLRGDGTGQHLLGLLPQATVTVGTYVEGGDTHIDTINNAITELEDNDYIVDGIVLHPSDWRRMLKIKTDAGGANTGEYILGGPVGNAAARLWDVPIARTTAMPRGKYLVGQFRGAVQGYDRMRSRIDLSTSHASFFIQNRVAIRAEERVGIAVRIPAAFRYGSFV